MTKREYKILKIKKNLRNLLLDCVKIKKTKKIIIDIIPAFIFLVLFSYCQKTKSQPIDKNIAELKMILFSDGGPEADLVWEEISKLAKKDINATVKVEFIPQRKKTRNRITIMLATSNSKKIAKIGKRTKSSLNELLTL